MTTKLFRRDDLLLEGTVFEAVTPDLYPLFNFYCVQGTNPLFSLHLLIFSEETAALKHYPNYDYEVKLKFGGPGPDTQPGKLHRPRGVAVDTNGLFYVVDSGHSKIQIFHPDGKIKSSFGSNGKLPGEFKDPMGITFDLEGNLIIVDHKNSRIQIFDSKCNFKSMFGKEGGKEGEFDRPYCVTLDNSGNLLISDAGNSRIQLFTPAGVWLKSIGSRGKEAGQLAYPIGVAVDRANGNIVVCDHGWNAQRIQIYDPNGKPLRVFGRRGTKPGEFSNPWGISVDRNGCIVVADQSNYRIQIFSREGEFLNYLGSKRTLGGPLTTLLDKEGNLVVVDENEVLVLG